MQPEQRHRRLCWYVTSPTILCRLGQLVKPISSGYEFQFKSKGHNHHVGEKFRVILVSCTKRRSTPYKVVCPTQVKTPNSSYSRIQAVSIRKNNKIRKVKKRRSHDLKDTENMAKAALVQRVSVEAWKSYFVQFLQHTYIVILYLKRTKYYREQIA